MKRFKTDEQGIGLIAIIAIVAVLGIGGVAAVSVYNNTKVEVVVDEKAAMTDAEEKIEVAKAKVESVLLSIKADIEAGLDTNIEVALKAIAEARVDLAEAYVDASAEAMVQFENLDDSMEKLEAEVKAGSQSASETLSEIMVDLKAEVTEREEAMSDTGVLIKSESETETTMEAEGHSNGDMEGEENMVEGDALAESDSSITVDSDMVDVESDTSVDAAAGVEATDYNSSRSY